jgi:hypothetical protein
VYRDEEGVKEKQLLALEDGCMRERRRKVDECKKVENIGSINGGTVLQHHKYFLCHSFAFNTAWT